MDCNCNHGNITTNIATSKDGLVTFDRNINWFNEYYYDVDQVIGEEFGSFRFDPNDSVSERAAYEKAASLYNDLVSDEEAIPLF